MTPLALILAPIGIAPTVALLWAWPWLILPYAFLTLYSGLREMSGKGIFGEPTR